ncbi:ankyrin repeat-containing protein [Colletotrichum plurivorum]|uniref:Ankyrin repeat-containing protein n=1 Tax=Colletotrichum plurivorum TaxID=2175906 RepID=A0A8H6NJN4_9PEZI|nr:ankyrin repeat-containing protein [Colletotrichum plurivorum]
MARQLADVVHPTFVSQARKLLAKTLEGKSLEVGCYWSNMKIKMQIVLLELEEARPERIMLDVEGKTKGIDRLKIWIESVTKKTWNWWPLQPPKYPMKPTETRIGWRCFEKFCRDGFAHRGLEMPDVTQKDYYYAPRPALHDPPISPEEFSHIYHHKTRDSSPTWALLPVFSGVESLSDNSVECIPQRYHYLDERSKCKEDFWGLHVRERRSAAMTSSYIILSLSPFLLFCVLYLLGFISGDIQNATTPLALALTSLGLLLGSLIKA